MNPKSRLWLLSPILLLVMLSIARAGEVAPLGDPPTEKPSTTQASPETPAAQTPNASSSPNSSAGVPAAGNQPTEPGQIRQDHPRFFVSLDVNHFDHIYREGDPLTVTIELEQEAYAYVLYEQADGKVYQIFPNSAQKNNRLPAHKEVTIPAADDQFRWQIGAPFGKEQLKIIASKKPLADLEDPALRAKRFNSVVPGKIKQLAGSLASGNAENFTEQPAVEIITYGRDQAPPPRPPKRVGVLFGMSKFMFSKAYDQLDDSKDRFVKANNMRNMAAVLRKFGKVDVDVNNPSQFYLDERSTKQNIRKAITEYLPSVTQPGDTVFVYFDTHGGLMGDFKSDDGRPLYCLMPYEGVEFDAFVKAAKLHLAGKSSPEENLFLATCVQWIKAWGSTHPKADLDQTITQEKALDDLTMLSDEELAHWLQSLLGRRVVVILSACNSGGFVNEGKAIGPGEPDFKFLAAQFARVKGINPNMQVAVLTACGSKDEAQSYLFTDEQLESLRTSLNANGLKFLPDQQGPFAYFIAECMRTANGPLTIEAVGDYCSKHTQQYVEMLGRAIKDHNDLVRIHNRDAADKQPLMNEDLTGYKPQVFNYCSEPVVFKP